MTTTKQKIINASIDLFAEKGTAVISVAYIARRVGLSKGGLYYHFKHGKKDIIAAILTIFEDCVKDSMPDKSEWESKNADPADIISKLFFKFEKSEALKLRKITRIIISGMHHDRQIKQYAEDYFIDGREQVLASCFKSLSDNGLIPIVPNPERAARVLNSLLIRCATVDSKNYPYSQALDEALYGVMSGDCESFISNILTGNKPF